VTRKHFEYPETANLFEELEEVTQRSSVSRGQSFNDCLTACVCALAGGTMEEEYLAMVERHKEGHRGKRGIDLMPKMFAQVVMAMERRWADILGDLYYSSVAHADAMRALIPHSLADLVGSLMGNRDGTVCDPICGTGRLLLAAAKMNRNREFIAQDADPACVRITAINLALWNLYAHVIHGDLLTFKKKLVYRTGFSGPGFIRKIEPEECPKQVLAQVTGQESGEH